MIRRLQKILLPILKYCARKLVPQLKCFVICLKGALQKRKECEKLAADHKMEQTQLTEVTRRTDVVSYALLSEINHFHSERAEDFKQGMKNYLNEQILFYEKVS